MEYQSIFIIFIPGNTFRLVYDGHFVWASMCWDIPPHICTWYCSALFCCLCFVDLNGIIPFFYFILQSCFIGTSGGKSSTIKFCVIESCLLLGTCFSLLLWHSQDSWHLAWFYTITAVWIRHQCKPYSPDVWAASSKNNSDFSLCYV